ncbi:MAG: HAMP domain-containing histidine kinase [Bryobacteraceae bacterium]|nr:HAMP domain-containing histidine kinase [Bryobacteraceae bacterium]
MEEFLELFTRRKAESDAEFRLEVDRLSQRGLRVIGWVEIGLTTVSVLLWLTGLPLPHEAGPQPWAIASFLALGAASLAAARKASLAEHARAIAFLVGSLTAVVMSTANVLAARESAGYPAALDLLTVLLVAVAVLPVTPLQVTGLGLVALGYHAALMSLAIGWGWMPGFDVTLFPLGILAGLCVMLSGVNHTRIHATWLAHKQALEAAESMKQAAIRSCHAQSASTTLRLAAALSHELNTPLGALRSSVDTMVRLAERLPSMAANQQAGAARTLAQLQTVAEHAAARLHKVIQRMQRFTNLDRAEIREIDLRQLIDDVIELHAPADSRSVRIEVELASLPKFEAPPQALSGVLPTLLNRAIQSTGAAGAIRIGAKIDGRRLRLTVEHEGAGADGAPDFDPAFQVREGRIGAANWDLFSARQIVLTHGGEISVERNGRCAFVVDLPVTLTAPLGQA